MLKFAVKRKALELFHEAVNNKDTNRVRTLLEHNRDQFHVDELDDDGLTALQRSCFTGSLRLVQLLLAFGADIGIQDKEGWTVLHAAAVAGNQSILRYLIAMGADIAAMNDRGETALDCAGELQCVAILAEALVKAGHFKLAEVYFSQRPDVHKLLEVKLQANAGSATALRQRSTSLKSPSAPTLISRGQRSSSFTVSSGRAALLPGNDVRVFINSDGYRVPKDEGRLINEYEQGWRKACPVGNLGRICCNCGKRRTDRIKRLSVASTSSASSDSSSSSDSAYLSNNSKADSSAWDSESAQSTSEVESCHGSSEISARAQCAGREPHGYRARARRAYQSERSCSTIHRVIQEVDDINELNTDGVSLLHKAASNGDADGARVLLENGAEINRQALNGSSPLHAAVASGSDACTSLLIEAGADLFAETDSGHLPIDLAVDVLLKKRLETAMFVT